MGFCSKLFGADPKNVHDTCIKMYHKIKRKRPYREERDYLKMVLLTKPPFDYLLDTVVDRLLDDNPTIEELATYISKNCRPNDFFGEELWAQRERNLKFNDEFQVKARNQRFFTYFWANV